MVSTTISLFSNILKRAGRTPKHGKKGGIKDNTVIKATEDIPYLVRFTSAATLDHCLLKNVTLPKGSIIAFDRAYIDYKEFEKPTAEYRQRRTSHIPRYCIYGLRTCLDTALTNTLKWSS